MAFSDWEMKAGDPKHFAFKLAFLPNPHGEEDIAIPEERESWGAFTIWAHGENLCAHLEQSEVLDSAHWYMLPMIEWLVDNWDALLHEERLPLRNFGTSAAEALASSRRPPVSLKEIDEFKWLDTWSEWWSRHCVRSSSEGGLFPDLYIRRYRDQLEISTGAEPLLGIPDDIVFLSPNRNYGVATFLAAEALFTVLGGAVQELQRRIPDSPRIERLATEYSSLRSPNRFARRLAWLAGLTDRDAVVAHDRHRGVPRPVAGFGFSRWPASQAVHEPFVVVPTHPGAGDFLQAGQGADGAIAEW